MSVEQLTPLLRTAGKPGEDDTNLPASDRIRYRLIGAQCRYHANDNIAGYILASTSAFNSSSSPSLM